MTKFTELLGNAGRRDNEPLGFGREGKRSARTPDILVVGRIGTKDLSKLDVKGYPVDAFLLETEKLGAKLLTSASKTLNGAVWGVRVAAIGTDEVENLKASGADFIVFDASVTRASILGEEELGAFLSVAPDLGEDDAQAVHALPIDGVAIEVDASSFPLTIETLMRLHRAMTSGAHAVVLSDFEPKTLTAGDLEAMRGAGVSALALPAASKAELGALRKMIADLPEPKHAQDDRMALIPHASAADEQDEFDEDDDYQN
jgi:hypothetical protein